MLNKEEPAWKKLCEECSFAAKEVGITKEDTDRIIKETREMLWKANKYDELIEKLEKKIRYYEENDEILATSNDNYSDGTVIKKFIDEFREILSILKGE